MALPACINTIDSIGREPSRLPAPERLEETAGAVAHEGIMVARFGLHKIRRSLPLLMLAALLAGCPDIDIDIDPPPHRDGLLSGRVLVAPGVGLAGATLHVEQLHFYDGRGELRRYVSSVMTDEQGYFEAAPTGTAAGLLRLRTTGGTFRDVVSGEAIELDSSTGLRALYRLEFFQERTGLLVTPVHSLIEAQFRYITPRVGDVPTGLRLAHEHIGAHFGGVDYGQIGPADVSQPAISPIDPVRAAFVLGGLSVLADDLRAASDSTPQAVNLFTFLDAASKDLAAGLFDGNDGNDRAPGSGLQVGTCPPVDPSCAAPPSGACQLGACRPLCDLYVNVVRGALVGGIRKFVGSRQFPSPWNRTGLGAEDARPMLEAIGGNSDVELFGGACLETADRVAPTITWETADEGAFVKGTLTVKVRATDDAEALPLVRFANEPDRDGDPSNHLATAEIDTHAVNGGEDGPFSITAIARDQAGNERRATRTLQIDNTAPGVQVVPVGFFPDGTSGVWWTGEREPILRGSLDELHPRAVEIVIAGEVVATATIEGSDDGSGDGVAWSARLPPGKVTSGGNEMIVRAVDLAGNVTTTTAVQLRLDDTPPGVLVESSPVYDERNSTLDEQDIPATNTWLQRHVTGGAPIDLAQSMNGACATVYKFSHLLHENFVLGATGLLNPMKVNLLVSDDGVGIEPGTAQARLTIRGGQTTTEVMPWTAIPGTVVAPKTTRHLLGLYRDGTLAIPQLATTEGEYHVELRARDKLGRTSLQERCWNHRILAPKPAPVGPGARAEGFARAMYSTSLDPGDADFAAKFLNSNAAGAAVWIWRVKNYLATPVYVTVDISRGVNAYVSRDFVDRNGLTNYRSVRMGCGANRNRCTLTEPTTVHAGSAPQQLQQNVKFRARFFVMNGAETGAELGPCAGCTNDDDAQVYTFEIPARATPQGAPLVEYAVLTYLRPTLPAGMGTDVLMAPRDGTSPDTDPSPYGDFMLEGVTLTGKLIGGPTGDFCVDQEPDFEGWVCTVKARRQRYRALTSITFEWLGSVETTFKLSATPDLPKMYSLTGKLFAVAANNWSTSEELLALP